MSTATNTGAMARVAMASYLGRPDLISAEDAAAIMWMLDGVLPPDETVASLRARLHPLVKPQP